MFLKSTNVCERYGIIVKIYYTYLKFTGTVNIIFLFSKLDNEFRQS